MSGFGGDISIELTAEKVAVVTLSRPPHNYISRAMIKAIGDALAELDADPSCRAVLLAAAGKNFCAGAMHDPDQPETMAPDTQDEARKWDAVARLFASQKPIVAAVQGAAVGAGFGLAMLADFRVGGESTRFAANFVKIGFCPGFGLPVTLPRVVGAQRAAFMFETGRRFSAEEVAPWGLVDVLAAEHELHASALALATELAGNAPLGMAFTRKRWRGDLAAAVRASLEIDSPEQSRLRLTEDHVEGVLAYRERRAPNFNGR